MVFEISYLQKRNDLPKLANMYIVESNGSTCVAVELDIGYNGKQAKRATMSIWRLEHVVGAQGQKELAAKQTVTD
jgi:hypothetical protein